MGFVYNMAASAEEPERNIDEILDSSSIQLSEKDVQTTEKYVPGLLVGQKKKFVSTKGTDGYNVQCTPLLVDMRRLIISNSTDNAIYGVIYFSYTLRLRLSLLYSYLKL